MRQLKPGIRILIVGMTAALCSGLTGCYAGYDEGPEWDGSGVVGGGYYYGGYYHNHHDNAFHGDRGRHPVAVASDRGRASLGGHGGGVGHAGGGGHR